MHLLQLAKVKNGNISLPGLIGLVVGISEMFGGLNLSARVGERKVLGRKSLVYEEEEEEDGVGENGTRFWCCLLVIRVG